MIYLDSAATTLEKPASVRNAVTYAINHCASPGRGGYKACQNAEKVLFECRSQAAELFDVPSPEQIILTSSATHGLNIAIRSLVEPGSHVVITGYEHNAVTRVLHAIPNVRISIIRSELFNPEASYSGFEQMLKKETVNVVICNHVSNVFGFIQPMDQIAQLCNQYNVPLIVDVSQSAGILPVSMRKWNAAFIAMPGHKGLYGPQGTGLLLCREDGKPLVFGGTGGASIQQGMPEYLPDRLEAGTQNVCGAAGLLAGMRFVTKTGIDRIGGHERKLSRLMMKKLQKFPGVLVFSGQHQSGLFSFQVRGRDCESVAEFLGRRGVAVRSGLHCAPLAHKTAGTLERGTIRVSFSAFVRPEQVEQAVEVIREIPEVWGAR